MSRILVDNFAHGALPGFWVAQNPTPSLVTAKTGMSGGYCLQLSDGASVRGTLVSTVSDLYMAFKWYCTDLTYSSPCNIVTFLNSSAQYLGQLNKESNSPYPGRFWTCRGNNGTWLATPTLPYYDNYKTNLVEIRYKPATDGSGVLVLRINGREVINYTGQTSDYAGPIKYVHLGWVATSSWKSHFCIGDIVMDDAAFPGMSMFASMVPGAAGNSTQWSPSAGSNWDCVEEIPASMSQYVKEDTNDQLDLYTMSDPSFPATPAAIRGLQVMALTKKIGAPAAGNVKLSLRTNSTNYDSSAMAPGTDTTPLQIAKYWATNPNTSNPWAVNDLNSLEIGVKAST